MNRKGFTLIELLAGIAIIGVFALVFAYLVNNTLATSMTQMDTISDNEVFEAARSYVLETNKKFNDDAYTCVGVDELVDYGYLDNNTTENLKDRIIKLTKNMTTKVIESVNYDSTCK